jgi:hypothetical protein
MDAAALAALQPRQGGEMQPPQQLHAMTGYETTAYSYHSQPVMASDGHGAVTPFGRMESPGSLRVHPSSHPSSKDSLRN